MSVGLYHLYLAKADQLCRLHYSPGAIKRVKALFKELEDGGIIQSDTIPTKFTRAPYYYTLTRRGIHYLSQAGVDIHETAWRDSKEINKHSLFVEHALELNDVLIAAALLKRIEKRYVLERFIHERVLKRRPFKATWVTESGVKKAFSLIPDAFLDFRVALDNGRARQMAICLEHDRDTEGQNHFRERIRSYIVLQKGKAYEELFGVKAMNVVFTTFAGETRLQEMRSWTQAELAKTNEPEALGRAFVFARLTQPLDPGQLWLEPHWYTPYEDGKPPVSLLTR